MSVTRAEDRPDRSHVPPTPPAKLAPADDPAWAATFMIADAAREARPTTTNKFTSEADQVIFEPARRKCYGCGARLAVEVQFHEAPHSTTLGAPTLRGSDVEWAQQFRPDRKGQTDG